MTPIYPIYTSCKNIMSSRKTATTPAARRPLARAAKAPRATTSAPRRARIDPFGAESGGTQADAHEAAEASGHDTSDGESSGADQAPLADSERALGGDAPSEPRSHSAPVMSLDGEAESAVLRVQERIDDVHALQREQAHPGDARSRFGQLGIRLSGPRRGAISPTSDHGRVGAHGVPQDRDTSDDGAIADDGRDTDSEEAEDVSKRSESRGVHASPGLAVGAAPAPSPAPRGASEGGGSRASRADVSHGIPTLPGYVEEALSRERTSANIRYRLRYVGCNDSAAVVAHELRTRMTLIHYLLPDDLVKALSKVDWRPSTVGIDICHRILSSAELSGFAGSSVGQPIAVDDTATADSLAEVMAAGLMMSELLSVPAPVIGPRFISLMQGLMRNDDVLAMGPRGARVVAHIMDEHLRLFASTAAAFASFMTSSGRPDSSLAPRAPDGLLSPTSDLTRAMVRRLLTRTLVAAASPPRHERRAAAIETGPRTSEGRAKCPDFAFSGKCSLGDRCPLAHVRLTAGERRRWTARFVRRPRGSRPEGGKSSDKTGHDKSDD